MTFSWFLRTTTMSRESAFAAAITLLTSPAQAVVRKYNFSLMRCFMLRMMTATAPAEAPGARLRVRHATLFQPYPNRIAHSGIWVEPELLAEVEYRAKSAEGRFGIQCLKDCERTFE
jgi:hypothetical protein